MIFVKLAVLTCVLAIVCGDLNQEASAVAETKDKGIEAMKSEMQYLVQELEGHVAKAARATKENKDLRKENQVLKNSIKNLQSQVQESRFGGGKRLKDAALKSSSVNGSLSKNSTRMATDCVASQQNKPFPKPIASIQILQKFNVQKTWDNARKFCKSLGGDLASFPAANQLKRANTITGTNPEQKIWIGGRCLGTGSECSRPVHTKPWKWTSGENIPLTIPEWKTTAGYGHEPENYSCLSMYGIPGAKEMLYAISCDSKKTFVCQF